MMESVEAQWSQYKALDVSFLQLLSYAVKTFRIQKKDLKVLNNTSSNNKFTIL